MTKPLGIRIVLSPELTAWVGIQAEDIGCDAATWIRMLVVAARKQERVPLPTPRVPAPASVSSDLQRPYAAGPDDISSDDTWRGPVEEEPAGEASSADIAAIIEGKLAEAEAAGAMASPGQPVEMFSSRPPPPASSGTTRALRAPPPRYSTGSQPAHLRAL